LFAQAGGIEYNRPSTAQQEENPMTQSQIRFSMSIRPDPGDEELLFARQLGIPCAYTWV